MAVGAVDAVEEDSDVGCKVESGEVIVDISCSLSLFESFGRTTRISDLSSNVFSPADCFPDFVGLTVGCCFVVCLKTGSSLYGRARLLARFASGSERVRVGAS